MEACRRGEGLVERIRNPEIREKKQEEDSSRAVPDLTMPSGRVLVIDDEADVVAIIRRYLIKEGLCVQGFTDSRQALNLLRADPFCCDLVITDMDMPSLTGAALSRKLQEMRPELPVIMVTGHDRHVSGATAADLGIREVLLKPLNRQTLLTAVRRLLVS
jgi:DNA-binding NtrC family response regulator